jgi:hypothetical protein
MRYITETNINVRMQIEVTNTETKKLVEIYEEIK